MLLRKINLLRSDLSRFKENCESFNEKTEKEIKLLQKVDELEEMVRQKDKMLLELKSKNLDLTKEIFQNKEHKKLEEKCQSLQAKLQGRLTRLFERPEGLRKESRQVDDRQAQIRKGELAVEEEERRRLWKDHVEVQKPFGRVEWEVHVEGK